MFLSVALMVWLGPGLAADAQPESPEPKAAKAREITIDKGVFPEATGGVKKPTKITSKAELKKAIKDSATQEAIAQKVDFRKEMLLVFNWGGSRADKLTMTNEKEKAVFTMKYGMTLDFLPHTMLFVLPAKMKYTLPR